MFILRSQLQRPIANARLGHKSQLGMTLVEIVLAIGVVSFVASLSAVIIAQVNAASQRARLQAHIGDLRDEFTEILSRDRNWSATINDTTYNSVTTFECLRTPGMNCPQPPPPAAPGDPTGFQFIPLVYHEAGGFSVGTPYAGEVGNAQTGYRPATIPTAGFNPDGGLCDFFSLDPGATKCPVRIEFYWKPACSDPANCVDPEIEISMRFLVRTHVSSGMAPISEALYNRTFRRKSSNIASFQIDECQDPTPIAIGIDGNGNPICVSPADIP